MNLNTTVELTSDWNVLTTVENDVSIQDFLCLVDLLKVSEELIYSSIPGHLIQKYKLVKQLIFNTILKNRDDGMLLVLYLNPSAVKNRSLEDETQLEVSLNYILAEFQDVKRRSKFSHHNSEETETIQTHTSRTSRMLSVCSRLKQFIPYFKELAVDSISYKKSALQLETQLNTLQVTHKAELESLHQQHREDLNELNHELQRLKHKMAESDKQNLLLVESEKEKLKKESQEELNLLEKQFICKLEDADKKLVKYQITIEELKEQQLKLQTEIQLLQQESESKTSVVVELEKQISQYLENEKQSKQEARAIQDQMRLWYNNKLKEKQHNATFLWNLVQQILKIVLGIDVVEVEQLGNKTIDELILVLQKLLSLRDQLYIVYQVEFLNSRVTNQDMDDQGQLEKKFVQFHQQLDSFFVNSL